MYYQHPEDQRQRHRERISEMREDYRRSQRPPRHEIRSHEHRSHVHMRSMWQWMREHAMHPDHAHRA
ncbi:MAG TPA: hypothetical protein VHQ98_02305 [Gaiellaceae bacterium]|nr:hypothetical protein [Gaiellaceae bacterium]